MNNKELPFTDFLSLVNALRTAKRQETLKFTETILGKKKLFVFIQYRITMLIEKKIHFFYSDILQTAMFLHFTQSVYKCT